MAKRKRPTPRIDWDRARGIFDHPDRPAEVTERQFDDFDEELRRLARTPWEAIDFADLWYYHHDLAYVELQPDLFAYLFPVCLMDWQDTLLRNESCSHGNSEFHRSLLHGQILEKMLSAWQRTEVLEFFRDGFLDRLDQERGFVYSGSGTPAYGWMYRFNSLGTVMPDLSLVWNPWWRMPSTGTAVASIQWCSGLMYYEGENPLFGGWTPGEGDGGPYLWESDSEIYDSGWLPSNVDFLRNVLSEEFVADALGRAVARLEGEPEEQLARRIEQDCSERTDLLAKRCRELPDMLAASDSPVEWPH